ncbi:MAG: efflux RND transporter periplasmic adaptor subunit [Pirellulaceae bacterium]|nr:efflux RND transporter periplasmic adaptor subunit [Pirellulaceae bacterium]
MRTLLILVVILALAIGIGVAAWQPTTDWYRARTAPKWRTAEVVVGDVVSVVNSTGTVKPVLQVTVGSFVSGPVLDIFCEFNDEVKKGELLATIDPRIYDANVVRDRATLASRVADVERAKAVLQQAINDEKRALALRAEDPTFIAQQEIDKVRFNRLSLEAQLTVAKTSVDQAQGQLDQSLANLEYTKIISPVDGIVINRKIDPGQTVAASFQTPELFIVAPDMREQMHVHASVDEADVGLISAAKSKSLPVTFTVDAYPDDLFTGKIEEIRLSSTTTQNVVTYPVVVAAANPDLKLLPGMTASLSFEVDRRTKVVKVPNSALRFFPLARQVREQDKPLIEGKVEEEADDSQVQDAGQSAEERAQTRRDRAKRHVWVQDGHLLRAIEVTIGLSDSKFSELVSGDLKPGDKLVIGVKPTQGWGG